jgi:hypothetical protein
MLEDCAQLRVRRDGLSGEVALPGQELSSVPQAACSVCEDFEEPVGAVLAENYRSR